MRCSNCGATNPDGARWCGQCLTRFDGAAEPTSAAGTSEATLTGTAGPPAAGAESEVAAGSFRRRGEAIEWACPSCGEFNGIDLMACSVCGTAFAEQFREEKPEPPRNWTQAMALSAIAPGAGHLAVGRYGSGASRLVLFLVWAIGAVLLTSSGGRSALIAVIPLLLGMVTVWVGSIVDLYRLQHGETELLVGRRLLWLVIGVLALLGIGLFGSLFAAAR